MQNTNDENINSEETQNDVEATEKEEESLESFLSEESDDKDKELSKLREANKKLYERAKKAEAKAKVKTEAKTSQDTTQHIDKVETSNFITRDEAILLTQGLDEASIEKLKMISKATGVSLADAQKDELFVAFKEKREQERKSEKANLRSSNSSGTVQTKDISSMERDEHKEFVRKAMEGR